MSPSKSDIIVFISLALLALSPQVYLATSYGIRIGELYLFVASIFITLLGITVFGYIVMCYIEERYILKYKLDVPLLAALVALMIQSFLYYWLFSLLQNHILFISETLYLFIFSESMSILFPLLAIAYLSKE